MWNECTWMQQTKKASDITEQFKGTTVAKRLKKNPFQKVDTAK